VQRYLNEKKTSDKSDERYFSGRQSSQRYVRWWIVDMLSPLYITEVSILFAATVPPPHDSQDSTGAQFYQDAYVMVLMVCAALVLLSAALLGCIAFRRR
jgi:hypothetical protein